ncbi:MAG: hypothetical protein AAGJ46_11625 [Planctomycetota bacterium]
MNATNSASLMLAILLAPTLANAQGTANAPSTVHVIDSSSGVVWIGGPNDPINGPDPQPIDLDPTGLPWRKAISTGPGSNDVFGGGTLLLSETILNVGDEPWTDWHEIDAQIGSHGTVWGAVLDVRVNGTSITYSEVVTPTTIDLFNFSQLVMPGDVLEIDKTLVALTENFVGPNTTVASILQYPTIPEPTTAVLAILPAIGLAMRRRLPVGGSRL